MNSKEFLDWQVTANDTELVRKVFEVTAKTFDEFMDPVETIMYAVDEIATNGLFSFYASQPCDSVELVEHLREIGASEGSRLIDSANHKFPEGKPPKRTDADFMPIDDRIVAAGVGATELFQLESDFKNQFGEIEKLLASYIRAKAANYAALFA
jgi:hypothetical protein